MANNIWKIIHTDNFGGDYPNEKFVTELPTMNKEAAQRIAAAINLEIPADGSRFYKAVPMNYRLQPGFEP